MVFPDHVLLGAAAIIPAADPIMVSSISPVVLPYPERVVDMELRVTAPLDGDDLPVVILSHGQGNSNWLSSIAGYEPLYNYWAGQGFVVIQPTHLGSATYGLQAPPGQEYFWEARCQDIIWILDHLDEIQEAVPSVKGRLDTDSIAIAGHSMGGWTASMILGAQNTSPLSNGTVSKYRDSRIKAGVVLAGTGNGVEDLSDQGRQMVPNYNPDFSTMETPALVVYGDSDVSPYLTVRGADWHGDAYYLAPGPKDLFIVRGGKHSLGGVGGWDALETEDESPERLASVQRATSAYLRTALYGDDSWQKARAALQVLGYTPWLVGEDQTKYPGDASLLGLIVDLTPYLDKKSR
ncbi:unnamed protein product [Clonostachys rhizophaga]|uniref:1-alkyl-2-acetylglycerophosphocholine esterase n=1 Tax=Clonostachys rhizophaga TaxID=160324 RepID=A0A9N9VPP7_9HYPO|nr:unnamed protein product [Clonostachys rhizophaga]